MLVQVKCYESVTYTIEVEAENEDAALELAHDVLLGHQDDDGGWVDGALRVVEPDGIDILCEVTERDWNTEEL